MRWLLFASVTIAMAGNLWGQAGQRRDFAWNPKKLTLDARDGEVAIELPQSVREWVVGIQVKEGPRELIAGVVQLETAGGITRLPVVSSVTDLEVDTTRPGRVIVQPPQVSGVTIVHAVVQAGTRVVIIRGGEEVLRAVPNPSLLVRDGLLLTGPVAGRQTVLMEAMLPPGRQGPSIRTVAGTNIVNLSALKEHLAAWSDPPEASLTASLFPIRNGTLEMEIDETGAVRAVRAMKGSESLLSAYAPAIKNWRFRPFEVAGTRIAVKTYLPFFVASDGMMRHPLHPSVSLRQ